MKNDTIPNSTVVMEGNEKEKFQLNLCTKGFCFLCLKPSKLLNDESNSNGTAAAGLEGNGKGKPKPAAGVREDVRGRKDRNSSSDDSSSALSIQILCKHLKINLGKIMSGMISTPEILEGLGLASIDKGDMRVSLCEPCGRKTNKFSELFQDFQRIQMEMEHCLDSIRKEIEGCQDNAELVKAYQQKMSRDIHSLLLSGFISELKKEISKKCSDTKFCLQAPQLNLSRVANNQLMTSTTAESDSTLPPTQNGISKQPETTAAVVASSSASPSSSTSSYKPGPKSRKSAPPSSVSTVATSSKKGDVEVITISDLPSPSINKPKSPSPPPPASQQSTQPQQNGVTNNSSTKYKPKSKLLKQASTPGRSENGSAKQEEDQVNVIPQTPPPVTAETIPTNKRKRSFLPSRSPSNSSSRSSSVSKCSSLLVQVASPPPPSPPTSPAGNVSSEDDNIEILPTTPAPALQPPSQSTDQNTKSSKFQIKCNICQMRFPHVASLYIHKKRAHNGNSNGSEENSASATKSTEDKSTESAATSSVPAAPSTSKGNRKILRSRPPPPDPPKPSLKRQNLVPIISVKRCAPPPSEPKKKIKTAQNEVNIRKSPRSKKSIRSVTKSLTSDATKKVPKEKKKEKANEDEEDEKDFVVPQRSKRVLKPPLLPEVVEVINNKVGKAKAKLQKSVVGADSDDDDNQSIAPEPSYLKIKFRGRFSQSSSSQSEVKVSSSPTRRKSDMDNAVKIRLEPRSGMFPCPFPSCTKKFTRKNNTFKHYRETHVLKPDPQSQSEPPSPEPEEPKGNLRERDEESSSSFSSTKAVVSSGGKSKSRSKYEVDEATGRYKCRFASCSATYISQGGVFNHHKTHLKKSSKNFISSSTSVGRGRPRKSLEAVVAEPNLTEKAETRTPRNLVEIKKKSSSSSSYPRNYVLDRTTGKFRCPHPSCKRKLSSKISAQLHYEAIHLNVVHKCNKCQQNFRYLWYANKHMANCNGATAPSKKIPKKVNRPSKISKASLISREEPALGATSDDIDDKSQQQQDSNSDSDSEEREREEVELDSEAEASPCPSPAASDKSEEEEEGSAEEDSKRYLKIKSSVKGKVKEKYQCTFQNCEKSYQSKRDINRHYESQHLKVRYRCDIDGCEADFSYMYSLTVHQESCKRKSKNKKSELSETSSSSSEALKKKTEVAQENHEEMDEVEMEVKDANVNVNETEKEESEQNEEGTEEDTQSKQLEETEMMETDEGNVEEHPPGTIANEEVEEEGATNNDIQNSSAGPSSTTDTDNLISPPSPEKEVEASKDDDETNNVADESAHIASEEANTTSSTPTASPPPNGAASSGFSQILPWKVKLNFALNRST